MVEDRRTIIDYILYFLCLVIISLVGGYYSNVDTLLLISAFIPIIFIPLLLLFAYKAVYEKTKPFLYLTAIASSVSFYNIMLKLRKSDILDSPNIGNYYFLILLFSIFICYFISVFSYHIVNFFGIRFDDNIQNNIKTISCTADEEKAKEIKNLVEFLLTEFMGFEYSISDMGVNKFIRNDNEFTIVKYSEIQNPSASLTSYIMFYNDQDGIRVFDHGEIKSFSLILEKFLGGNIIATPEGIRDEFKQYFSIYRPKIKEIHEFFGKSQINWLELKNPLIVLVGTGIIAYAIFNIESIIRFISELNTDTVVKIAALIFALPASIFYLLKIFGKK